MSLQGCRSLGHSDCDGENTQEQNVGGTDPFDPLQVSLQQTVQREADDVVHVLHLQTGSVCELKRF